MNADVSDVSSRVRECLIEDKLLFSFIWVKALVFQSSFQTPVVPANIIAVISGRGELGTCYRRQFSEWLKAISKNVSRDVSEIFPGSFILCF